MPSPRATRDSCNSEPKASTASVKPKGNRAKTASSAPRSSERSRFGDQAAVLVLALGAAMLDAGTVCDQTLGRRAVNLLNPRARGRLNGLFVGLFFAGGALGSALSGAAWEIGGWAGVCGLGLLFTFAALAVGLKRP